jgi:hypothetical protein
VRGCGGKTRLKECVIGGEPRDSLGYRLSTRAELRGVDDLSGHYFTEADELRDTVHAALPGLRRLADEADRWLRWCEGMAREYGMREATRRIGPALTAVYPELRIATGMVTEYVGYLQAWLGTRR